MNISTEVTQNLSNRLERFYVYVPEKGLEPLHLAAYAPEAYVATNYTTWAILHSFVSITTFLSYASGVFRVVRQCPTLSHLPITPALAEQHYYKEFFYNKNPCARSRIRT